MSNFAQECSTDRHEEWRLFDRQEYWLHKRIIYCIPFVIQLLVHTTLSLQWYYYYCHYYCHYYWHHYCTKDEDCKSHIPEIAPGYCDRCNAFSTQKSAVSIQSHRFRYKIHHFQCKVHHFWCTIRAAAATGSCGQTRRRAIYVEFSSDFRLILQCNCGMICRTGSS